MTNNADVIEMAPHLRQLRNVTLLITSMYQKSTLVANLGKEGYSYRVVYNAFADLLKRWGNVVELEGLTEEQVAAAAARMRQQGLDAIHLSFLPPHQMPVAPAIPNVSVLAWEYPDVPNEDLGGDPRHNWLQMVEKLPVVITHTNFSREAFVRAGARTPVHVVPVPIRRGYFDLPLWRQDQRVTIDCPCLVLKQTEKAPPRRQPEKKRKSIVRQVTRQVYRSTIKPLLPGPIKCRLTGSFQALRAAKWVYKEHLTKPAPLPAISKSLELSGVVYTSVLNPFDSRKNWTDLLTGFLLALHDREDATLVIKLISSPDRTETALQTAYAYYKSLSLAHKCRVVLTAAYLSNEQLFELARASTYYLNTSRAEGSCLPLQDYLAAARPAIAPAHTGMADSMISGVGFQVESFIEPSCWPQDPELRIRTTCHRLNWESFVNALVRSYEMARARVGAYHTMGNRARDHMHSLCSTERVWPMLVNALDAAAGLSSTTGNLAPLHALRRAA